ncbi:quinone oxidoreductase family protein [Phaeobacter porticola]|uniref:Alcohol dehydrogenase, zinc binding protein n=1 Tax=Phaeobacter porticola TaxID=1844006 RepID=A0A1L3I694_9RHOB|nr:zinc-binding dehydrogenase [Phaeobacter porticola]APG47531.1 alcohol dehydrogenase, zinc binding protein [Phaeobacter porticola]
MRAIHVSQFGGPDVLKLVDVETPELKPEDTLINVEASGVNFADSYFRAGAFPGLPTPPFIAGMEGVGRVSAAPVGGLPVGQRVAFGAYGTYAEQAVLPGTGEPWHIAVPLSDDFPVESAAGLMMSGRTAYLLADQVSAQNAAGTALVYAAAGGVGWVLCQLLKLKGMRVIALVGDESKKDALEPFDLAAVVNRKAPDAEDQISLHAPEGVSVVFNAAGGETIATDLDRLANFGQLIWYGFGAGADAPGLGDAMVRNFMRSVSVEAFNGGLHSKEFNARSVTALIGMIENGQVVPVPATSFELADAHEAHKAMLNGSHIGKMLLTVG